jgi:serine/threonine protein phosphatase 1
MLVGQAKIPEGLRVYAIGDVHGCDQLLAAAHSAIGNHRSTSPSPSCNIVHLGDYGDRGPDSAAAIGRLADLSGDPDIIALRGNHDQMMLDFLADPDTCGAVFLANGGKETLRSYGIRTRGMNYAALGAALAAALPANHLNFMQNLAFSVQFGDYFFCHAGIRPGVPLAAQDPHDLLWIREEFLSDQRDHGVVVVHGHTPTDGSLPEIHPNRVALDTGAVFGGPLTVAVFEGTDITFL